MEVLTHAADVDVDLPDIAWPNHLDYRWPGHEKLAGLVALLYPEGEFGLQESVDSLEPQQAPLVTTSQRQP